MRPTLSVVIPALNEASGIAHLLEQLAEQTTPPDQVVLADAHSIDDTRAIARAAGALVVDGGMPAVGRNAGAGVATGEMLLFLDADVDLDSDFIESAVAEFLERDLTIAGARIEPLEREPGNLFACEVANFYLEAMQYVSPHAPGFCMLTRKATHEAIGGFDEEVLLAEDHDYAQRAAKLGKFRILRTGPVRTSMRRIEKEGILQLAFKYVYCELHVVAGQKIYEVPFDYEFASFGEKDRARSLVAIDELRAQLGDVRQTLTELSEETREALWQLAQTEVAPERFEAALARVGGADAARLRRYVGARVRLARRGPRAAIARVREAAGSVWAEVTRVFE
ncbi:MAG: glycosyltransferase [Coriobacteriia bacterium]|nr:glycosyltransferase [Coriobacteriia bacterium]